MAKVFISYSHSDEDLQKELAKHLAGLRREGIITLWHDRCIDAGEELHEQISTHLDDADIILLLISADFVSSDYCYDIEMKCAMERHKNGSARVIPVILRPYEWQNAPFSKLTMVPTDAKPVVEHTTLDEGFLKVAQAVRQAANSLADLQASKLPSQGAKQEASPAQTTNPAQMAPRSSNLQIKKQVTDYDRQQFLTESFEYITQYFENSLNELEKQNSGVKTVFRPEVGKFEAIIYVGGQEQSHCGIWLDGLSRTGSISFSYSGVGNGNSYNASVSVCDDGDTLHFEPMGITPIIPELGSKLTREKVAEYFWSLFFKKLQ